jgi:hypothetical protein
MTYGEHPKNAIFSRRRVASEHFTFRGKHVLIPQIARSIRTMHQWHQIPIFRSSQGATLGEKCREEPGRGKEITNPQDIQNHL